MENIVSRIKENEAYQNIVKDSFGGVMYDVADGGKYDVTELKVLFEEIEEYGVKNTDGIVQGEFYFVRDCY